MASPSTPTRLEYIGAVQVEKGKQYLASDFAASFPDGTTFILKSKGKIVNGVREPIQIRINGSTAMFPIEYGEMTAFDSARSPALTYVFSEDCIVAICKDLTVV